MQPPLLQSAGALTGRQAAYSINLARISPGVAGQASVHVIDKRHASSVLREWRVSAVGWRMREQPELWPHWRGRVAAGKHSPCVAAWIVCTGCRRVGQHLENAVKDHIFLGRLNDNANDVINTSGIACGRGSGNSYQMRVTVSRCAEAGGSCSALSEIIRESPLTGGIV